MADIDQVSNQLQSMKNVLRQYKTASNATQPQGDKLEKLKSQWTAIETKVSRMLDQGSGRDWEPLKRDFRQLREEFAKADRAVAAKQSSAQADAHDRDARGNDPIASGGAKQALSHGMAINMAPLDTEEALQRDKLQGIIEIEGAAQEVKALYSDFNDMVQDQQKGLDVMEGNVSKSVKHVEKGVVELKTASQVQKSSRKWMCCIIVIVVLVIVGVVIAVVVVMGNK